MNSPLRRQRCAITLGGRHAKSCGTSAPPKGRWCWSTAPAIYGRIWAVPQFLTRDIRHRPGRMARRPRGWPAPRRVRHPRRQTPRCRCSAGALGCVDSHDNAADFVSAAVDPRNSASPTIACQGTGNESNGALEFDYCASLTSGFTVTAGANMLLAGEVFEPTFTDLVGASPWIKRRSDTARATPTPSGRNARAGFSWPLPTPEMAAPAALATCTQRRCQHRSRRATTATPTVSAGMAGRPGLLRGRTVPARMRA